MSLYDTTPTPPQTYELVPDIASRLSSDSDIQTAVGSSENVFQHREELQMDPDRLPDRLLVVREPVLPGGASQEMFRWENAPIQVKASVTEHHENPEQWISEVHRRAFELLQGYSPTITKGSIYLPLDRMERPSGPGYNAELARYYASCEYRLVIKPA